tara:strand:+ start:2611 stop:3372 length:762 start_codon:yes stop_codon:yes gene_type:complete
MPIPTVYTPIQPLPSIVGKPAVWTPNVWTGTFCPGNPPVPEIWSITVTNFTPIIAPAPYNGDPGITLRLTPGTATVLGAGVITTGVLTGPVTATLSIDAPGGYTDYLFPNKEYKYRSDLSTVPVHAPVPVVGPSGYSSNYGTVNQLTATPAIRQPFLNPVISKPIAGEPVAGLIADLPAVDHMIHYFPDPRFVIVVQYTLVITSSCGIGAGTYTIRQIVYDDKDIAAQRFVTKVQTQLGRNPLQFPNPRKKTL